jgi:pyruvate/2-oxoglutarate dehydrogenase complex dihydrolipoamide dehydrogenase (E3) component
MAEPRSFDVVIIGGGQAGIPLAHALAGEGRSVALIERKHLGGSCVNFGCTPTKAAVASARLAHEIGRAREFGVEVAGWAVDFPAVIDRARAIAAESRAGLERGLSGPNPAWLRGQARLAGRDGQAFKVRMDGEELRAREVVLNTGTRTRVPPIAGIEGVPFVHAGNWLDHRERPEHVIVLGGGVIALEMSQFYRRMGSRVTIVERGPRIAKTEDEPVSLGLQDVFRGEGIELRLGTVTEAVSRNGAGVRVRVKGAQGAEELTGSHLFVATGRQPNTDDLGLETVGVTVGRDGAVGVDERLSTPVPGLWVGGDIRGGPQFTHTSWDDYRILFDQMTGHGARTTRRIVPYAIFTDPEVGRVGMNEAQAKASGRAFDLHRFEMARNGRARERGSSVGFVHVIVERGTHLILGATVFADQGAELVHLYVDLMNAGAPATVMRDAVHIHPTMSEGIQSAVAGVR